MPLPRYSLALPAAGGASAVSSGASLEFMDGKKLPSAAYLLDK
ncbi:hypothetical protein [Neopoerus faecalis]|nr:hypothetical protein [Neopoerus faecalis]